MANNLSVKTAMLIFIRCILSQILLRVDKDITAFETNSRILLMFKTEITKSINITKTRLVIKNNTLQFYKRARK